jgi:hypothetical protein
MRPVAHLWRIVSRLCIVSCLLIPGLDDCYETGVT